MASWATPGDVFQPVRQARRIWETTQPQLFLELDPLLDHRHDGTNGSEALGVPVPLIEEPVEDEPRESA